MTSWGDVLDNWRKPEKLNYIIPIGKDKPRYSLSDERLAVMKARRWDAQHSGEMFDARHWAEVTRMSDAEYQTWISEGRTRAESLPASERLSDGEGILFYVLAEKERIRNLILTNPKQAALELRIPHLAIYPQELARPTFTLVELGDYYVETRRNDDGDPLSKKYRENTKRAWKQFCEFVAVRYARDITTELAERYYNYIMGHKDSGKSRAWVRTRFVAIKTILQYGFDRARSDAEKKEYRTALDACSILKSPQDTPNPKPISAEHFHAIYDQCAPREQLALLLGLNACAHGGEVMAVKRAELDLKAGTLACRRPKTKLPRVASLWPRTVTAIEEHLKTYRDSSPYLFVARTGSKMSSESLRQRIVSARDRANRNLPEDKKIPDHVTFEGLRDAAFTVGEEEDAHFVKYVAGHKVGESDKYVLRQAMNKRVIAVCGAIERYFFSPPPETAPEPQKAPDPPRQEPPKEKAKPPRKSGKRKKRASPSAMRRVARA